MTSGPSPEESPVRRRSIGGEFPLHDSSDAAPSSTLLHQLEQLAAGDLHLFASGRGALRALLRAQAAEGRDTLILPGYICDSVLRATKYAGTDWRLRFLHVTPTLEPDANELVAESRRAGARGLVLAVPLFGFDYSDALREAVRGARDHGSTVAWDLTHGLFSDWAEQCEGPRVASLRKWCGLPDGGALLGGGAQIVHVMGRPSGREIGPAARFVRLRLDGMGLKGAWVSGASGSEDAFLRLLQHAERELDGVRGTPPISPTGLSLTASVNAVELGHRRRLNYNVLLDGIRSIPGIRLLHPDLPAAVCPFGLPVLVDDRDRVRARLAAGRAFCPVHWPVPASVPRNNFPEVHELAGRALTLPVDQRYGPDDMARLTTMLRSVKH
jgi:nucleotide-binding universal stress UspA family protein